MSSHAQQLTSSGRVLVADVSAASSSLPDAPGVSGETDAKAPSDAGHQTSARVVPIYTKYVPAGWTASPLTAHDKVILGLRDAYSPFSFIGYLASAGFANVTNGQPNYGTNLDAFGQRFGATVLRDASEGIFTDSVYSPLLHEDPRYYVEGPQHGLVQRLFYSITRPIITRSDSGRQTVNAALLLGYASGSAISYTYYPAINQNFRDTVATFGGSLGGAAFGDFVSEFADQFFIAIHLEKQK